MSRVARALSRRGVRIVVATAIFGATAAVALGYFTSTGAGSASASIGNIDPPTNVVATASNNSTSSGPSPVTITWDAPSSGATPTGYLVVRDSGSSQATVACSESPCTDTGVPDGTYTYHVQSLLGTAWNSSAANSNSLSIINDTSPPTTTITFPTSGSAHNATGWAGQCESGSVTGVCGTASDATGVAAVRVSLQRASDGDYWNGSSFVASGSELFDGATLDSPGSTATNWSLGLPIAALTDGSYTIHVQAKDTIGNDSAPRTRPRPRSSMTRLRRRVGR